MNIFQWGEKILFKLLQKSIQTNGRVQKYVKTCCKVRFSTLKNVWVSVPNFSFLAGLEVTEKFVGGGGVVGWVPSEYYV